MLGAEPWVPAYDSVWQPPQRWEKTSAPAYSELLEWLTWMCWVPQPPATAATARVAIARTSTLTDRLIRRDHNRITLPGLRPSIALLRPSRRKYVRTERGAGRMAGKDAGAEVQPRCTRRRGRRQASPGATRIRAYLRWGGLVCGA